MRHVSRRAPAVLATAAGRLRGRHLFAFDLIALPLSTYVSVALVSNHLIGLRMILALGPVLALVVLIRIAVNLQVGLYTRAWRHASIPELGRIVAAIATGTVAVVGLLVFTHVDGVLNDVRRNVPASFWLVEPLVSLALVGGARVLIRAAVEWPSTEHDREGEGVPTLLYGAGATGALMARSARRTPAARVTAVGFLDDDPTLAGSVVAGLPVFGGVDVLERAAALTAARSLLITMPNARGEAVRRAVDEAIALGLTVRTVPGMTDLLDGTIDAHRVRRVRVEDLLRRPITTDHPPAVREIIRGQTVLITGAGGSIGSELARQVFALEPRRLVLVDRAESGLYLTQRDLESARSRGLGSGEVRPHLGNVVSRAAMYRLVATERPAVVFHAAAYKHVPMMEDHPSDAAYVNVGGTLTMLEACLAADVPRFVLVSTDKAVRPSSVMGASKRIAEMLVADVARRSGKPYVSVRFGNVLGSNGSVVPIFQQQLEQGEPLTITHPDMTRFFMTIPEAAWLILDAASAGDVGDLFVLDMGEPIRVMDLARDLIRLSGKDPDTHPITIIGLRPGEKLHEELFYSSEDVVPTSIPKVLRAIAPAPPASIRQDAEALLELANGEREPELRSALLEYAGGLRSVVAEPPTPDAVGYPVESARSAPVVAEPAPGTIGGEAAVMGSSGYTASGQGDGAEDGVTGLT